MRMVPFVVVLACVATFGCGGSKPTPNAGAAAGKPAKPSIKSAGGEEIGPTGDTLPPLDGGRLELAGPKDWVAAARDKKFVAQFTQQPGAKYPRIMITADSAAGVDDLTAKNVKSFAKEVQDKLDQRNEDDEENAAMGPPVTPLKIGDRYWVESTRKAHAKGTQLERLVLVTVAGGRRYTLELRVYIGALNANRPHALAVAKSFRPLDAHDSTEVE